MARVENLQELAAPKACPFVSQPVSGPDGRVAVIPVPCMELRCKFFNTKDNDCKINMWISQHITTYNSDL